MCALVSAVRGLKAKFLNLKYKREKNVRTLQQKLISMYTLSALQIDHISGYYVIYSLVLCLSSLCIVWFSALVSGW